MSNRVISALVAVLFLTTGCTNNITMPSSSSSDITFLPLTFSGELVMMQNDVFQQTIFVCAPGGVDPDIELFVTKAIATAYVQSEKTGGLCSDGRIMWTENVFVFGRKLGSARAEYRLKYDHSVKIDFDLTVSEYGKG